MRLPPNHALQRTRRERRGCNPRVPQAGSLSLVVRRLRAFMKIASIITLAFLLVGCASSRQSASLSAQQAATQAIGLANDKAFAVYQTRPFKLGQPAQFVAGHWIWSDRRGYGRGDLQASVELAVDGTPQKVDVTLLDSRPILPLQTEIRKETR
jgi:hypothetical protein